MVTLNSFCISCVNCPTTLFTEAELSKVRVGFVGVGNMGQMAHLRNNVPLPEVEVAAIAEMRHSLGEKVVIHYSVPKVYPSHVEMLAE